MLRNFMFMCFCVIRFGMPRRLRYDKLPQVLPGGQVGVRRGSVAWCSSKGMVRGTCAHVAGTGYFLGLAVMQVLCGGQAMAQMCGDWEILAWGSHKNDNDGADLWGPGYSWGSQQLGLAY